MHAPRPHHVAATALVGLTIGAAIPASLAAQTVTGRVVDSATRRPLARVIVRLVPASASVRDTVYATDQTEDDGAFVLTAPAPGSYRVWIGDGAVGPVLALNTPNTTDAREYVLAPPPAGVIARLPDGRVVSGAALDSALRRGAPLLGPRFEKTGTAALGTPQAQAVPEPRRCEDADGCVIAQFVVDTTGRADMSTWKVLRSTNDLFAQAAKNGVRTHKFFPAELDGHKVRQLVRLPFTFTLSAPAPK